MPGTETVTLAERNVLYSSHTADGAVKAAPGSYHGFLVTATTAAAIIEIRDAVAAGGGTILDVIPIGTAAGTRVVFPKGITCAAGVFIDYAATATGTIVVLYT